MDLIRITRKNNENSNSIYRRFTRHFRSSDISQYTKRKRYQVRELSRNVRRKERIKALKKQEQIEKAYRLGKISSFRK